MWIIYLNILFLYKLNIPLYVLTIIVLQLYDRI